MHMAQLRKAEGRGVMGRYLVEIAVKYTGQHVEYREVEASDNYYARHIAIDEFNRDCRHMPKKRRELFCSGIHWEQCCAPDSVELESARHD